MSENCNGDCGHCGCKDDVQAESGAAIAEESMDMEPAQELQVLTFEAAMYFLKQGALISRIGWNIMARLDQAWSPDKALLHAGTYISMADTPEISTVMSVPRVSDGDANRVRTIIKVDGESNVIVGWTPSVDDIFTDDWVVCAVPESTARDTDTTVDGDAPVV